MSNYIKIIKETEHENGGCTMEVEMGPETVKIFTELGIQRAIELSVEKMKEDFLKRKPWYKRLFYRLSQ